MLAVPADWPPTLLVVVDTEEEFDWRAPPNPACRAVTNVLEAPMLQAVFDRYGVRPAYLIDHPVADNLAAASTLRRIADDGRCEVGAHLHPWVTPPVEEQVDTWHAYACNLPPELERRKLETLTAAIAANFDPPRIFKAGAYGIGAQTPRFLADLGYKVDSSIVPFTTFADAGGPDFQDWDGTPFKAAEGIVEIPLSTGFAGRFAPHGRRLFPMIGRPLPRLLHLPGIAARLGMLERLRLTPEGHTFPEMARLTRAALARGERLFMLTMHSSSMLPGATDYVRSIAERAEFLLRIGDM